MTVYGAPGGPGPNGITVTPDGATYFASLAGNIARPSPATGRATAFEPPTRDQGARGVSSDSQGRIWVSESSVGQLALFDPQANTWKEWQLPAPGAEVHAVYVDDCDIVWVTDFTSNAILSFDPATEKFTTFALTPANALVQQLSGRPGEVWGAESGADRLVVIRTGAP
jgi:virginiamycin B lyase